VLVVAKSGAARDSGTCASPPHHRTLVSVRLLRLPGLGKEPASLTPDEPTPGAAKSVSGDRRHRNG
jgi:hypothetical protein